MSTANVTTPVTNQPTWTNVISWLAIAIIGTLHASTPTVVPPAPPAVVVQPKTVDPPKTDPVTPPVIVAPVKPIPTVTQGVRIVDDQGNAVEGTIAPGIMLLASAPSGTVLTPVVAPASGKDAGIDVSSPNRFTAVLRNNCLLQIVVTGSGTPSIISIQCASPTPPQPIILDPPVVIPPKVVTPPAPIQDPKYAGVRVIILEDPLGKETEGQVSAINSPKVIAILNSKTVKDASGRPSWRKWNPGADVSREADPWPELMQACMAKIAEDPKPFPLACVANGEDVMIYSITNETATLSTLNSAFGS